MSSILCEEEHGILEIRQSQARVLTMYDRGQKKSSISCPKADILRLHLWIEWDMATIFGHDRLSMINNIPPLSFHSQFRSKNVLKSINLALHIQLKFDHHPYLVIFTKTFVKEIVASLSLEKEI